MSEKFLSGTKTPKQQNKFKSNLSICINKLFKQAFNSPRDIIHISHGFEGVIPEYQPRGDTKALARYHSDHLASSVAR